MHQLVEQFLKLKPLKFDRKGDPEAAPRWVEELEKVFEVLGCTEAEKVTLAVYQLQDNASDWWKATRGECSPRSARERKLAEFMRLRHGQMTMDQYEAEFARLSKFTPRMVDHPEDKARRFRDRLRANIRSQLIPAIERDRVDRATASGSRFAPAKDNRRFEKKPIAGNRRFVPHVKKNIRNPNHPQSKFGACFKCGNMDHQIRNMVGHGLVRF
ncbi:uncharacterized protein LOC115667163 [Syzygium oleosum]|uniref:uncharacterized protein LOC115667163 n=1 Tax=Syzygium oleosum TaxID=219896 RepID=UPI0024BA3713|nr:uncharacterized protein LOC115667163 [Syzygium oleosum]